VLKLFNGLAETLIGSIGNNLQKNVVRQLNIKITNSNGVEGRIVINVQLRTINFLLMERVYN